jgi:hypothetical protein
VRARNQASWALGAISEFGFGIINTATQHNPCKILCISHDLLLCFAGLGRKEGRAREEALVGTPSHQDTTSFKKKQKKKNLIFSESSGRMFFYSSPGENQHL